MVSREDASAAPPRGSLVIYTDGARMDGHERFRIAEVVGPTLVDPETGDAWVGVLVPSVASDVDVIDCATVTKVVTPS